MKITPIYPPRTFTVGLTISVALNHCADITLEPDEQVTFVTPSGTEFDIVRKSWGYYGTPSINQRLRDHGLRAVLVRGGITGRIYLLLVEAGHEEEFQAYVIADKLQILAWLDTDEAVEKFVNALNGLSESSQNL